MERRQVSGDGSAHVRHTSWRQHVLCTGGHRSAAAGHWSVDGVSARSGGGAETATRRQRSSTSAGLCSVHAGRRLLDNGSVPRQHRLLATCTRCRQCSTYRPTFICFCCSITVHVAWTQHWLFSSAALTLYVLYCILHSIRCPLSKNFGRC